MSIKLAFHFYPAMIGIYLNNVLLAERWYRNASSVKHAQGYQRMFHQDMCEAVHNSLCLMALESLPAE